MKTKHLLGAASVPALALSLLAPAATADDGFFRPSSLELTATSVLTDDVDADGQVDVDDGITTTFTFTNTGTQTIDVEVASVVFTQPAAHAPAPVGADELYFSNWVLVDAADCNVDAVGDVLPIAPGTSHTCTYTHTATPEDVVDGSADTAVFGLLNDPDPDGRVSATNVVNTSLPADASSATGLFTTYSVELTGDNNGDGIADVGDEVTTHISVTNLVDNLNFSGLQVQNLRYYGEDGMESLDHDCPTTLLAGATVNCTATYTVSADDLATGATVTSLDVSASVLAATPRWAALPVG